jgi:hypothetical protein
MGRTTEYTIMGPPGYPASQFPPSSSKSLPYRNASKHVSSNLRKLYRISAQDAGAPSSETLSYPSVSTILPTSPHLPPTPPGATNENSASVPEQITAAVDTPVLRTNLVTPVNQNSPPTPDNTPPQNGIATYPRPFLATHPSMASTGAESFITAREDLTPDLDADGAQPHLGHGFRWRSTSGDSLEAPHRARHFALPRSPLVNLYGDPPAVSQSPDTFSNAASHHGRELDPPIQTTSEQHSGISGDDACGSQGGLVQILIEHPQTSGLGAIKAPYQAQQSAGQQDLKRGRSLRDRLLEAQTQDPSASTEKFANIIGWNSSVPIGEASPDGKRELVEDRRRFSGISTTSTVEAYVVEQATLPRRKTTLRHVNKHESLRSVSSPLPVSDGHSRQSMSDSPHRLVHKKARLSNQNRWSFGSEVSKSYSLASSTALPKAEVIRVAVIPERRSSLSSTAHSSQRQSRSTSSGRAHSRKESENPPTSWHHKRAFSESTDRGRPRGEGPVVPPRSSSLSAPTSRSTSRANSITSEHLHVQRQRAEKDLRKTLDRMESERLLNSLRGSDIGDQIADPAESSDSQQRRTSSGPAVTRTPASFSNRRHTLTEVERASNGLGLVVPGSTEWAALRPPSIFDTPFSQPSFQSNSPEISEALAINYFAHNNHSLQLIEPFSVAESKAVREVHRRNLPEIEVESPLRNPRQPPHPPQFTVIPPTPSGEDNSQQLELAKTGSVRRPGGSRRRSESFMSSISRNLSLKNALNRKADQDLDNSLHPMWRPRAFWDDIDNAKPEAPPQQSERSVDQGIVNNSLGLPQERIVISGPVSLIRRLSERRKQHRGVVKQPSRSSLAKFRASRKLHRSSGMGLRFHLPLIGVKDLQERILHAKQRKEDERREKRRADLRRSIGTNVILQGDSRFPASNTSLGRHM